MSDILGDGPDAEPDVAEEQTAGGFFGEPTTLAFIAFALAVSTVLGAQVFRGLSYSILFAPAAATGLGGADGASTGSTAYVVAGAFLTAAFSLIPLVLGRRGLGLVIADDPIWLTGLLRAAIALAGLSLVLRLIGALILAATISGAPGPVLGTLGLPA